MSEINFLPRSYLKQQERQHRVVRETVVVMLLAIAAMGGYFRVVTQTQMLQQEVLQRQAEVKELDDQLELIQSLRQQQAQLEQKVRVHRELNQPLAHTAILATLGQIMPGSVGVTDLALVATPPQPPRPTNATEKKVSSKKAAKPAENQTQTAKPLRVELVGLAPNDVVIADFMAKLIDHPLFKDVKMLYSKPVDAGELSGREFRIEMLVPFDREYRPSSERGEVAHAH